MYFCGCCAPKEPAESRDETCVLVTEIAFP